jgi:hypothetical protein
MTPKVQAIKEKVEKSDLIKCESYQENGKATHRMQENICKSYTAVPPYP